MNNAMQFQACCPQCQSPVTIQVPGTAGLSSCTNTTADFVIPAIGSDVTVSLVNTSQLVPGSEYVFAAPSSGVAHFQCVSITSALQAVFKFLGEDGDVAPGITIVSGSLACASGTGGAAGENGENGYTQITSTFQVPSVGQNVTIAVVNSACFVKGQNLIVGGTTNIPSTGAANFSLASINSPTSITITFLGYQNDVAPGVVFEIGTTVTSAGSAGQNAYTTTTAQFTIPAIGSTVNVSVKNSGWMALQQNVVVSGAANFSVYSLPDTTHAVLTFLGYIGDLPPTTVIASSSTVSPSGKQAIASNVVDVYATGNPANHSDAKNFVLPTPFAPVVVNSTTVQITLPVAGKWLLFTNAVFGLNGADGSSTAVVSMKLRCTNNTVTDVTNSQIDFQVGLGASGTISNDNIGGVDGVYYQGNAGDNIQMQAQSTIQPSSGVFCITSASIAALQIG
jgi:hypothetical protein